MSNKKAFVFGIVATFGVCAGLKVVSNTVSKIVYDRVTRDLKNAGIIVGYSVIKKESKNEDKTEKEES